MPGSPFFPVQPLNSLSAARQRGSSESVTARSAPTAPQHGSAQKRKGVLLQKLTLLLSKN